MYIKIYFFPIIYDKFGLFYGHSQIFSHFGPFGVILWVHKGGWPDHFMLLQVGIINGMCKVIF